MKKAVFFDRDGVINKAIWRDNKATSPRSLEEWEWNDGIHEAIDRLRAANFLIFVITNQPDVYRELVKQAMLDAFHQKIKEELAVDEISACMHDDVHECDCRKPKPGMILTLAKKWDVSLKDSYVIGDTIRDLEAAQAANCSAILLSHPYNQEIDYELRVKNLEEAVRFILEE